MKKLLITCCSLLITLFCSAQFNYSECDHRFHPLVGMGTGTTHRGEIPAHLELGFFAGDEPIVMFTIASDVYKSKEDPDRNWPVVDFGPRLYYQLYTSEIFKVHAYGELRYASMGYEHNGVPVKENDLLGGYNNWYGGIGGSASIILKSNYEDDNGFNFGLLKFDLGYGATRAGRVKATITMIAVF